MGLESVVHGRGEFLAMVNDPVDLSRDHLQEREAAHSSEASGGGDRQDSRGDHRLALQQRRGLQLAPGGDVVETLVIQQRLATDSLGNCVPDLFLNNDV